jgi:acyl dehydratase
MPFDPARLLSAPPVIKDYDCSPRDAIIYALGVGADELRFVYEEGLEVLPTMAVVMGSPGFIWRDPEYGVDWKRVLHGEIMLRVHAPIPSSGMVRCTSTFGPVIDKGAAKGAIVYQTRKLENEHGLLLATVISASFLRGDGGFGGTSEGQPKPHPIPDTAPDFQHEIGTAANLATIYRLSGDSNPLHIDPAVASAAGFPAPILHGLATYGIAGRAILAALCENDPRALKQLDVRFSSPVYPGETVITEIWREGPGQAAFRCSVAERGLVVLNNGYAEFS